MMDLTPGDWWVHKEGYKYRVCILAVTSENLTGESASRMRQWLHTQVGDEGDRWIDQYYYICFVHELDASIFEMVWS